MAAIISTGKDDYAGDGSDDDLLTWILAWSELVAFGALLAAFVVVSWMQPGEFAAGKARLHPVLPVLNTIVLLASGWSAAAATSETGMRQRLGLSAAALGGLLFFSLKIYEYWQEGATLVSSDMFAQLYILLTGFHLAHVAFGSLVLLLVAKFPSRQNVHLITTLWHVIDIVWLVMFPVVYLL
ncbi:NorE accessory protein for nitric oxide reductase [Rhizobium sp. R72]|uniref:cytochrome c oxidase subunit 3 n=1 Tax=unclassified Rhizobium TaxID=2613769 RepID=UPI000B52F9A1|nr:MULTISPECIES: cytochrome c oxidase subunit 3 [unclassified Rhizobium]OWV97087.1 NorE accessory protein for nitric oxide reductase [Rhizobium sp. R72]OWV97110.1 NorE accessory protein for nitric oxide reductase [Rhizobium sp. R711]